MQLVAVDQRTVRWSIAPRGAAQGRWHERTALVIGVRGHSGATGLGEAAPLPGMSRDDLADATRAAHALAARLPLAVDGPAHASAIAEQLTAAPAARFAIETALLVALAQETRTSVARLWSTTPQRELTCAVVVDDEAEARAAVAHGARCLKLKAGTVSDRSPPCTEDGTSPTATRSPVERIVRIAAAVPGVRLRVDANRSWPRARVVAWLTALAALPIDYVEEPCMDAHELLAQALPCRIALDESIGELGSAELARALASPSLAAVVLKPTLLGGFARCLELAAAARRHGVAPIVSHTLEGPIGRAACVELARAIGADVPVGLAPHPGLAEAA